MLRLNLLVWVQRFCHLMWTSAVSGGPTGGLPLPVFKAAPLLLESGAPKKTFKSIITIH